MYPTSRKERRYTPPRRQNLILNMSSVDLNELNSLRKLAKYDWSYRIDLKEGERQFEQEAHKA